jgi:transcriptional regulator with XRE-family HTH domain
MSSLSLPTSTRMARIDDATPDTGAGFPHTTRCNSQAAPLQEVDLASAISLALTRAGLSHKEAAALMGVDRPQWSRQLNGNDGQHISLQRLTKLPRQFWLELLQQIAPALGIVIAHPDIADRAIHQLLLAAEAACAYARQDRALRAGGMR